MREQDNICWHEKILPAVLVWYLPHSFDQDNGGQAVYKDIVEFAGQVPGIDYGAYYSDIRSALTDAVTNVVQNDADIDEEIQNAQDTVEFNISE